MAFDIGTIRGSIKLDYNGKEFKQFEKDMRQAKRGVTSTIEVNEKLDKATKRSSGSMGTMGAAAAGLGSRMGGALKAGAIGAALAIGTGLTVALKDAYTEAREAEKVTRLTANAIKSSGGVANVTAKQIENLASSLSMKTAIDDETIQSTSNLLLTFRNIRNEAGKNNDIFNQATETALDMSQAYGVDLPSATKMLGKALQDPATAASALKRTGAIDEAGVERIKKMAEDGVSVLKMQKTLLNEINKAGVKGSAAAAADPIQKLQVAYKNLMETVGLALLPYLKKAANALATFINQMRTGKGPGGEFAKTVKEAWDAFKGLWPAIQFVGKAIGVAIGLFNRLPGPIKGLFVPFSNLAGLIQAITNSVSWMKNAFQNSVNWITKSWRNITNFFSDLPGKIRSALQSLGRILTAPFRWALDKITSIFDKLVEKVKGAINKIKQFLDPGYSGGSGNPFFQLGEAIAGRRDGGPVGPGAGGPRLFLAGEGRSKEWVISQEGDRKKNQAWTMEAASALGIPGFKNGGKPAERISRKIANLQENMSLKRREFELSGGQLTVGEVDRLIKLNEGIQAAIRELIGVTKGQAKKDARFALRDAQLNRRDLIAERKSIASGNAEVAMEAYTQTPGMDAMIDDLSTQLALAEAGYGGDPTSIRAQLKQRLEEKLALLRKKLSGTSNRDQISALNEAIRGTLGELSGLGTSGSTGPSFIEQVATAASLRYDAFSSFGGNAMQMGLGSGGRTLAKAGGTTVVLNGEFKLDGNDPHSSVRKLGYQIANNLA